MKRLWELHHIISLLFLLLSSTICQAFTDRADWEQKIDSMKLVALTQPPTEKIDTYKSIIKGYRKFGSLDSAVIYCNIRVDICLKRNDLKEAAKTYDYLGRINHMKGDLFLSIDAFDKGLALSVKDEDDKLTAHLRNSLGIAYKNIANYNKALTYFLAALEYWEEVNDKNQYNALLNVGNTYMYLNDYTRAEDNFRKALVLTRDFGTPNAETRILNSLGLLFLEKKEYAKANNFFKQSYLIKVEKNLDKRMGTSYYNLGEINMLMGQYDSAMYYYQKLETYAEATQDLAYKRDALDGYANVSALMDNFNRAIYLHKEALDIAISQNLTPYVIDTYDELASLYTKINRHEVAYEYRLKYDQLKDSLYNQKSTKQIAEIEARYELSKKERELQGAIDKEKTRRWQLYAVASLLMLSILILVAGFGRYRYKIKNQRILESKNQEIRKQNRMMELQGQEISAQNALLKQSNQDLEQFAYAISHDLREPLRTIRAYMQLLIQRYSVRLDNDGKEFANYAVEGAERMDTLLRDMMEYARIGQMAGPSKSVDLDIIIEKVKQNLFKQISENDAKIELDKLPRVFGNEAELYLLFQNLINNAIKFRRPDKSPVVQISAEEGRMGYLIRIKDNGIGIPKEYQQKIFHLFNRLHTSSEFEGTGIGLSICKRIVEKLGGTIWVESEEGKGTTFFVRLPALNNVTNIS
ncbi:MAG: ATP-binding protein [Bacteroidota bacterium]